MSANIICHYCGNVIKEGDKFCTNCGALINLQEIVSRSSNTTISTVLDRMEKMENEFLSNYLDSPIYEKLVSKKTNRLSSCGMDLFLVETEIHKEERELEAGIQSVQDLTDEVRKLSALVTDGNKKGIDTIQNKLDKKLAQIERLKRNNLATQERIKKSYATKDSLIEKINNTNNLSMF